MTVDGSPSSSILCFIRHLFSKLTERNSTKTCHMFESECELKNAYPKFWIYPPLKSGPKITCFRRFSTTSQRKNIFDSLSLRTKHDIDNRASIYVSWQLQGVSYTVSKFHELWPTNVAKQHNVSRANNLP